MTCISYSKHVVRIRKHIGHQTAPEKIAITKVGSIKQGVEDKNRIDKSILR